MEMQVMHSMFEDLACGVIKQAVIDANNYSSNHPRVVEAREDGINFILSRRLEDYIHSCHLDLDPDYIRRSIKR